MNLKLSHYLTSHNNQQTTYVHPTTGRSEVHGDAVQSPSPESLRYDVSSPSFSLFNGTLPDIKKPSNRKSYVGSWVKGPFLRRPDPSSITHQGWLLKQGSDGFQLWKRRWFVLSDYCLYYYKSQQEDKVLGYIPLPSFKIRPVSPEDRVYKRFAFKAEHANTRSYFFAAETKDQMTQWMNALSLASILQKDTSLEDKNSRVVVVSALKCERPSVSSYTSSNNTPTTPSADDSDSGFHGYKSKRFLSPESKSPVIFESCPNDLLPLDAQSFDEISDSSKLTGDRLNISADSCKGLRTGNRQPFYANAPPKPRRLNSSYEHSSTPDRSPLAERRDFINQQQIFQHPQSEPVEVRQPRRSSVYTISSERRTPEAYGATSTACRGDYEDVYGGTYDPQQKINQPHQRESFASSRSGGTRLSEDVNSQNHFHSPLPTHKEDSLPRNWHLTPRRPIGPPRPHSADFLEYDRKHGSSRMISHVKRNGADASQPCTQEPRPKSTVGYHHEGDFWSEENYAAKMRESAIYKKAHQANTLKHIDNVSFPDQSPSACFNSVYQQRSWDSPQQTPVEQRVPPAGAATPDLYVPQASMHSQDTSFSNTSTKSGHSKRESDPIHQYDDLFSHDHQNPNLPSEQNNFLRSASARITRNVRLNDSLNTSYTDDSPDNEKKIQQREESMKRLLEWKQRMLQSPLTRKSSSRPDSSASSSASTKITNGTHNNISPQQHYESESYRLQVLKELNNHEMQTQIRPNAGEQISKSEGLHQSKRLPSAKCATNKFHVAYNSPYEKTSVERPVPQGGSEDSNDFTNISSNGRRRLDGKRDLSRTRQISGGDSRRSASSSSRYNSYSSDEQDVLEERSTRRKTRKNSRRNNSDQKPDSTTKKTSNSPLKTVNSCFENEMGKEFCSPHDYVNINSLEESVLLANKAKLNLHANELDINGSERAVPVYIDDNDVWKREESKNMVFNDKYFAARDPYYVADVQIPSLSEASLNDSGKEMSHGNRASPIGSVIKPEIKLPEPEYENTNINVRQSKDAPKEPSLFSGQNANISNNCYNSIDTSKNKHYNALYEASSCDLLQELKNDLSYNNYQDDNSIGKYSDSGYDTLRAEIPIKKEDKWDPKSQNGSNENNFDISVASRKGSGKTSKRPETWSPDKFDRSRNNIDSKSKVEESQIVKEYSYEYIILEKSKDSTPNNLRDMSLNLKMSSPNLPSLESPRMVQETQQATTNRNLVKDRIKCFSSISEPSNSHERLFLNNCSNASLLKSNEVMNTSVGPGDNKFNDNFNSQFNPTISSEAYESNLNEEFVSSISTKTETQEAQVKILSETNEFGSHRISPNHNSNNACSESQEGRDPKSPQDIMDGRLNRLNIRKFVFDETEAVRTKNDEIIMAQNSTSQNHKNKRSVKDLLKSFELKLENAHDSNYNIHKEDYKRKFYSDSELLSNESSSDDSDRENILDGDKLPPPPASFLEDLRKETNVHLQEILPSLVPPPRPPKKVHLNCDMDSKGRPRSIRFSLAESIEESLRRTDSENEENGWFDTPSLKAKGSNSIPSYHNRIHNNNFENNNTFVIDMDKPPQVHAPPPPTMSVEENYLPMSPPKKPGHGGSSVGLSSSNSSLSSKHLPTPEPMYLDQFCKTELEEHMYIEMSGEPSPMSKYDMRCQTELPKLDVNTISDTHFLSPESPRYYEIGEKEGQHYEYIYKTGSHYEAIYMEVPNRDREANKPEDKPAIPNKPHDLKHMKPFHKKCSSDSALIPGLKYRSNKASEGSSDADDEASKDLDSIELPKKPRFSLSDTFRPASYYLSGADLSTDIDAHDSSDSDLVSPPPIPMSLPPTEDSDSKEGLKSKNNYDSRNASFNSPSHNSSFSSNSSKTLKFIANDGKEFKLASPHYNHRRSDSSSISNKYKRRPLLEETLDELNDESFVLRSEDIYPTSIGYPLGRSSLISDKSSPWSNGKSSKGNSEMSLLMDNDGPQRPSSSLSLNLSLQGRLDSTYASGHHEDVIEERIYENGPLRHCASGTSINAPYGNISSSSNVAKNLEDCITDFHHSLTLSPNASLHDTSHISCNSGSGQGVEDSQDHNTSIHGSLSSSGFNFHQRSLSELSNQGLNSQYNNNNNHNVQNISANSNQTPVHFRGASTVSNNSETSPRTAPYYYSDVIKDESLPLFDESSHNPRTRAYQLNNQRDLEANKRQDIGRKVNQISNTLSIDISNREKLQYELRHSFDLFDGKTTGVPDERNVYEADTLRKMKTRTLSPDPENTTKNLYPYGISLKSDTPSSGFPSHRRSRSLEGLVEDLGPRQRKRIRDWIGSNVAAQANNAFPHDTSISSFNNDASFNEYDDRQHNSSLDHQLINSSQISDRLQISSPHQLHVPERQRANSLHRSYTPDGHLVSSHHIHSIDRSFSSHGVRSPDRSISSPLNVGMPMPVNNHPTQTVVQGRYNTTSPISVLSDFPQSQNGHFSSHNRISSPFTDQHPQQHFNNVEMEYPIQERSHQFPSLQQALSKDNMPIESRDGSTSRLSHHETFSFESGEADNWEDDCQWREQLRRASLRHTKSLETLDESRPRSRSDYAANTHEPPSPGKGNLPCESRKHSGVKNFDKSLDEYHVDYRMGKIPPGNSHNETLERNRKGLTTVEEYEWDTIEERFMKPELANSTAMKSVSTSQSAENGHSFLAEGLPPSLEKETEPKNMLMKIHSSSIKESSTNESQSNFKEQFSVNEVSKSEEGGRSLGSNLSPNCSEKDIADVNSLDETKGNQDSRMKSIRQVGVAPDLIPNQDVTKLGEALHRRSDFGHQQKITNSKFRGMQSDSPLSNYSYGFGSSGYNNPNRYNNSQNYQPHPHANNPYHHYKSDDLLKYANHHPQPPQYQSHPNHEQTYNPAYQNLRHQPPTYGDYQAQHNVPYDRLNSSPYHQLPAQDLQDYYHNTRNAEYGSYDQEFREIEHLRQEEQMYQRQRELAYQQQYPDPEIPMDKLSSSSTQPMMASSVQRSGDEDALSSSKNFMSTVSAGELLGKTHEELVLLLIQLRRHQSALLAARRHTTLERDSQTRLAQLDNEHTEEHLQRIAYLEEHLQDLDKQNQMGKPLINLVDNMVKLGSLYRGFDSRSNPQTDPRLAYESPNQESLEFSRRVLEKRILAEDRQEYDFATPDQIDLEGKVMELYKLEKILQEESLTIQTLQRDKDMLERTLETLHSRAQGTNESMMEMGRRNLQRVHLEKELSTLRSHLAMSARRLEETAVENNRLEHEMMMLRQKIQANMVRNAQRETEGTSEARHIESEMLRVQSLLEHLQKRRLELSQQIQRLTSTNTENTDERPSPTGISDEGSLSSRRKHTTWLETDLDRMVTRDRGSDPPLDKRGKSPAESLYSNSPLYSRGNNMSDYANRSNFSDSKISPKSASDHMSRGGASLRSESHYRVNLGDDLPVLSLSPSKSLIDDDIKSSTSYGSYERGDSRLRSLTNTPLDGDLMDRNAVDNKPDGEEQRSSPLNLDINEADDRMKRYYGILPKEKLLEPKTVRIVKRESTERKKDRYYPADKMGSGEAQLSHVDEDDLESDHSDIENYPPPMTEFSSQSASLPRNYGRTNPLERANMMANTMRPSNNRSSHPVSSSGAMARPSNLPLQRKQPGVWKKNDSLKERPMSAHEQLFGTRREADTSPPSSPSKSDPPSPVFKSAAAREIIKEMAWEAEKHRRAVPKEKRRHFTISSSRPLTLESGIGPEEGARSRDDCDMVRALRPRNHPDVVKSTLSSRDVRFNESTIDTILGAPQKIHIPERYMPDEDDEKELSKEEKLHREQKATAIRKMLTESSSTMTKPDSNSHEEGKASNSHQTGETSAPSKAKLDAEKKEREHILAMNQILAKQVMEKSRMVAAHNST